VVEIMAELDLKEQIAALVASTREQTAKLEAKLDGISGEMTAVKTVVTSLEEIKPAFVDLVLWKPKIDSAVGALQADLGTLRIAIDNLSTTATPTASPAAPPSGSTVGPRQELRVDGIRPPLGDACHHGPAGHRVDNTNRGSVMGPAPHSTPAKGTFGFHHLGRLGGKHREWIAPDLMGKGHWSGN
jgi:hypothetical protein